MKNTDREERLRNYVYFDEKRLDSYVNQITPANYDKVPFWKVSFSTLGPKVEGEQKRLSREFTKEEKVKVLLEYLERKGQLATDRISGTSYFGRNEAVLRLEHCDATKLRVPATGNMKSDAILWISDGDENTGRLFLLENDGKNNDQQDYGAHSAYSTLLHLYEQGISLNLAQNDKVVEEFKAQTKRRLVRELQHSPLKDLYKVSHRSETLNEELLDAEVDRVTENHPRFRNPIDEQWKSDFATTPVRALNRLGARVERSMKIETLYRVVTVYIEAGTSLQSRLVVTFGYPIFIAT